MRLQIQIGNKSTPHDFFVANTLNRNAILGRDWLMQNGVRIYFDLGALKIGEEYVALEDFHISSIITLAFIGMTSYYRHFIRNFSDIAEPLVNLTRKYAQFQWSDACQTAFDHLKTKLADMIILAYLDPNKDYGLYTDASDQSIGTCLSQMVYDKKM